MITIFKDQVLFLVSGRFFVMVLICWHKKSNHGIMGSMNWLLVGIGQNGHQIGWLHHWRHQLVLTWVLTQIPLKFWLVHSRRPLWYAWHSLTWGYPLSPSKRGVLAIYIYWILSNLHYEEKSLHPFRVHHGRTYVPRCTCRYFPPTAPTPPSLASK